MTFQEQLKKISGFLGYKIFTLLLFIVLALLLFGALYQYVKPQTYNIELFSVADKTIRAPKTIEDQAKTDEEKQKAADEVGKVYSFKKDTVDNRVSLINSIFDFVKDENQPSSDKKDKKASKEETTDEKLSALKASLSANVNEDVTKSLPDDVFLGLLKADPEQLEQARNIVINQINSFMSDKIREEQVMQVKEMISDKIDQFNLSGPLRRSAMELGKYAIVPNDLYDPDLTAERKSQAMDSVEPIKILQGQVIVQEGHLIDRDTYSQLKLLGLLKSNPTIKPFLGLAVFVLMVTCALYLYFKNIKATEERKLNDLLMAFLIFIISLVLMKIIGLMEDLDLPEVGYIFPAALAPMLLRSLVNERFAFILTIILAACGSIVFHDEIAGTANIEMAIYILFSGTSGILFLSNQIKRTSILQAGFMVSCINVLVILFIILIGNGQYSYMEYIYYLIFAFVSGTLSSVLTIGLLPFFEAVFGILSTMRLIELSNPNHPLLKKILIEAPGTYHHSIMVANLSEAACEAIGANGLLARVGCYYHDIGKTKRPQFFIENQLNIENPHDHLDPEISKDIIIAHAADGAEMIRAHKLPSEIADIAEQHHGTTFLKYFFYKAKEANQNTDEDSFRYPGPKPRTKEAAIINIADSVEAAVRSMAKPGAGQIKKLINNIVQDRLEDGQLNECDITLKELEVIKKTFCETLNGIFHSRIEYPNEKIKGDR